MSRVVDIRDEIERVNLEVTSAERDYDLNCAAELKYGTLVSLQQQLKAAEEQLRVHADSAVRGGRGPCTSVLRAHV